MTHTVYMYNHTDLDIVTHTDIDSHTQTDRYLHTQTDRHMDRETDTHRHIHNVLPQAYTQSHADRQTHG